MPRSCWRLRSRLQRAGLTSAPSFARSLGAREEASAAESCPGAVWFPHHAARTPARWAPACAWERMAAAPALGALQEPITAPRHRPWHGDPIPDGCGSREGARLACSGMGAPVQEGSSGAAWERHPEGDPDPALKAAPSALLLPTGMGWGRAPLPPLPRCAVYGRPPSIAPHACSSHR